MLRALRVLRRIEQPTRGIDVGAAWCGTGLGDHRPCRDTYERHPCDTPPPLDDSQFTGAFQWLGDLDEVIPRQFERLQELDDIASRRTTIFWCAPSFEHFAYRFWLENRLWRAIHGNSAEPLDTAMQEYLDHYKAPSPHGA
ncbi:hypothetical protein GCM10009760_35990 [Kitasatospora kazusensis]|uniref:Uncharacterized protein n=1 Tax=Kitasatospora kazusensis TaxID=407974 RepID=A0ABN2ZRE1_9ACTN